MIVDFGAQTPSGDIADEILNIQQQRQSREQLSTSVGVETSTSCQRNKSKKSVVRRHAQNGDDDDDASDDQKKSGDEVNADDDGENPDSTVVPWPRREDEYGIPLETKNANANYWVLPDPHVKGPFVCE